MTVPSRYSLSWPTLARLWGARIGARYAEAFTPIPVLGRLPATARL